MENTTNEKTLLIKDAVEEFERLLERLPNETKRQHFMGRLKIKYFTKRRANVNNPWIAYKKKVRDELVAAGINLQGKEVMEIARASYKLQNFPST